MDSRKSDRKDEKYDGHKKDTDKYSYSEKYDKYSDSKKSYHQSSKHDNKTKSTGYNDSKSKKRRSRTRSRTKSRSRSKGRREKISAFNENSYASNSKGPQAGSKPDDQPKKSRFHFHAAPEDYKTGQ